ncbi:MAG: hypothetical protein AVDCRST_MAG28-1417, partial [uncultured Rubrobacteraceae bacterium]
DQRRSERMGTCAGYRTGARFLPKHLGFLADQTRWTMGRGRRQWAQHRSQRQGAGGYTVQRRCGNNLSTGGRTRRGCRGSKEQGCPVSGGDLQPRLGPGRHLQRHRGQRRPTVRAAKEL